MIESLTVWVLAAMAVAWSLTSKLPGAAPKDIAAAIATVSAEKPLFSGPDGDRQTAALMAGIARYESGFRQVYGDCKDKPPGWPGCGKVERETAVPTSFCFMQVHLPNGAKTAEGWTGEDLMADPLKCARAAREIIRVSIKASPPGQPLLQYAGRATEATRRFELAQKLFKMVPFTIRCESGN
jgi:hypothetical protein